MIMRVVWTALLAGVAMVTIFAQIDRSARFSPALSGTVPEQFRGFAQQRLTEAALVERDPERSLMLARQLIRVRPLPADHIALLARAQLLAGDREAAIGALQAAGMRGWREAVSQRAMLEAALASGNYAVAAQRLGAMMATGNLEAEERREYALRITQSDEGREALAAAMAAGGYWQTNFVRQANGYLPPEHFADLAARAAQHGAVLSCDVLDDVAQRFERQGRVELVEMFWPGDCPTS